MVDISILPKKIQEEVEKKIKEYKLKGKNKEKFLKRVIEEYQQKKVDIYSPIGLISAHSISEPATQMVIDTFHFAGVAEMNIMNSLPRVIEILDARVKPTIEIMEIYLKEKNLDIKEIEKYAKQIKEVLLEDVTKEIDLDIAEGKIIFKLDKKALEENDIKVEELVRKIKNKVKNLDIDYTSSRITFSPKKKLKLKQLYILKGKLKSLLIKGIPKIKKVIITENPETKEKYILTEGSNLKEVLKLDFIDRKRTITNNLKEIEEVLGIEAVRNYIIRELKNIYDSQGLEIDIRYLTLIADVLTMFGKYIGITRYGLASKKKSVLAKAAFEIPRQFLVNASLTGEEDNFETVLENVIINQIVPVGTGLIKVKYIINEQVDENEKQKEQE